MKKIYIVFLSVLLITGLVLPGEIKAQEEEAEAADTTEEAEKVLEEMVSEGAPKEEIKKVEKVVEKKYDEATMKELLIKMMREMEEEELEDDEIGVTIRRGGASKVTYIAARKKPRRFGLVSQTFGGIISGGGIYFGLSPRIKLDLIAGMTEIQGEWQEDSGNPPSDNPYAKIVRDDNSS